MTNPPLPIEIFDVLRAARWRRVKESWMPVGENKRFRSWAVVGTYFGVAWNPEEMHYFWRRMLGMDGK